MNDLTCVTLALAVAFAPLTHAAPTTNRSAKITHAHENQTRMAKSHQDLSVLHERHAAPIKPELTRGPKSTRHA